MVKNRVAVFAHYDKNNEIQDYVVYYIKELLKVCNSIVFVSDSDLDESELEKIKPYIKHSIVGKHGEYDFGSYKRGYFYAKENNLLEDCDELIFANDSCYAPLFPFEEMFSKMSTKDVDFWGPTENDAEVRDYLPKTKHLQSYFLVFKPQVFNHNCFDKFISEVKQESSKALIVIKYEIGMSSMLNNNGFVYDSYCDISKQNEAAFMYKYKDLIKKDRSPFLKRSIVLYKNIKLIYPLFIKSFLSKYTNYDLKFIENDKMKNAENFNSFQRFCLACKQFRRNIITIRLNRHEQRIKLFSKTIFEIFKPNANSCALNLFGIRIKWKTKTILKFENLCNEEKEQILNSGFWDADWYIKKYFTPHPSPLPQGARGLRRVFTPEEALDYWYTKGWVKGELPSKYFDENYIDFCLTLGNNPILQYISKGRRCFPSNYNAYKSENDSERIKDYQEYKSTRKAKGVVYTCITNDYDDIREIEIYKYIDKDWDYVCFTDNQEDINQGQIGIWEIRPLQFSELDNTRNQRWHKTNPHILFPNYEQSLWIDGNINILSDTIFKNIYQKNTPFLVTEHFKNVCIFQEYEDVLQANLDNPEIIEAERQLIINDGMPKRFGMPETNVLYRKHHDSAIKELDENWWNMINEFSKRDQLSASYLMWKAGLKPQDCFVENSRNAVYDFYVFSHKKGRD